ncbi:uncharacterized protein B0I36DRAFT_341888, partial [Microdochium trichocladiopsis]
MHDHAPVHIAKVVKEWHDNSGIVLGQSEVLSDHGNNNHPTTKGSSPPARFGGIASEAHLGGTP